MIAMLSMLLIIASVVISCLETMEYFAKKHSTQHQVIHIIEVICVVWFTAEILIRFIACPSKRKFVRQIMNWLDFAAIIPFYIQLFLSNTDMNSIVVLRLIRLIRVFRVFKLSRHSYSLQILGHTLKSSLSELFLLGFFLSIGVVVFSTLMFYAEQESNHKKFSSIPAGFWWAVVTMTTLGYGDIVPDTLPGKIVGTACAICGVLTIALPIPVIVSNFSLYYSHAKAKQKASQRKRPLVIGAANALKVIDPFVGQRATNLRLSVMSEHANYMSPRSRDRTWPKIALDMVGSSIDSSEPPASPSRRRLSKLPDKLWQLDQTRNFDSSKKQCDTTKKNSNENSKLETSEDNPRDSEECIENFEECTSNVPREISTNKSMQSSKMSSQMSVTSSVYEEPGQNSAKCVDIIEAKTCNGAYENEAIENHSENENSSRTLNLTSKLDAIYGSDGDSIYGYGQNEPNQNTLPQIKIICNSSTSQMSGSNNEDEGSDKSYQQPLKKKTKKKSKRPPVEKATSAPALSAATRRFSGKNLPGRMGRRDSVFVVGFLGKKWQAKAAKSRNNRNKSKLENIGLSRKDAYLDLLQVSSPKSTTNDESRRTSTSSFNTPNSSTSSHSNVFPVPSNRRSSESSFFRRSSCPTFQTLSISSDVDLQNGCKRYNGNEHTEICHDFNSGVDQENDSLGITRSNNIETSENQLEENQTKPHVENCNIHISHDQVDMNHYELSATKQDDLERKHDDNNKRSRNETNKHIYNLAGKQYHEGKERSRHVDQNVAKLGQEKIEDDRKCSEENVNGRNALDSELNSDNTKSKQEKLNSKQYSLSSNQSDSSLKAELDGTTRRPSSPLIRQRAFQMRERATLDGSDDDMEASEKTFDVDNHGKSRKASEKEQFASDKIASKNSWTSLMEIRKNHPSRNEEISRNTFEKENTKQILSENTPSSNAQISCDKRNNTAKMKPKNSNKDTVASDTSFESKLDEETTKKTNETYQDKRETKPVMDSNVSKTDDKLHDNFDNSTPIDLVKGTGNFSSPNFSNINEIESKKNFKGDENVSEDGNPQNNKDVDVYVKRLPTNFVHHNCIGLKNGHLNIERQALANGKKAESKIIDDVCRKTNAISAADQNGSNNLQYNNDTDRTNKKNDSAYNYAQNGGEARLNDQALRMQNNYRNKTSKQKYETIDIPEIKDPIQVKKHGIDSPCKTGELTAVNENILGPYVASKPPNSYFKNTPKRCRSLASSISSLRSVYQSTSLEFGMDSGILRKVEAQDSGVYCSDYRSSIDSVSSFTERNADRGMLKTISEVEHDHDSRDGMLYFQPFSSYYEESRSHVLEIRDETAV